MTKPIPKSPFYPKSHLVAASGVAALLSLALLVFPSQQVEAKRTSINLDVEQDARRVVQGQDDLKEQVLADTQAADTQSPSPFAQVAPEQTEAQTAEEAPAEEEVAATERVEPQWKTETVRKGDTLSTLFERAGLAAAVVHEVLASSKEAKKLTRLRVGQKIEFQRDTSGDLLAVRTKLTALQTLSLVKSAQGYEVEHKTVTPDIRKAYAQGRISSSLFASAQKAGLSHDMTMALATIFGYDIDFALDIQEGDEFEVVYEDKVVNGKHVGYGNILAARFVNKGKAYTAVRYTAKNGTTNYYTAEGGSMRKAFIRTPVEFSRISSRFTMGRFHPVLNKMRAHKGVDYAAPTGTPIHATGDGKIAKSGRENGYGNVVMIQHGKTYTTVYGHMSRIAKGMQAGASVKQGQVIGYVGMTGLATGPHLHYEFRINGNHVDPLGVKLPMADPIAKNEISRFLAQSQPLMARMDQERASLLAMNKR